MKSLRIILILFALIFLMKNLNDMKKNKTVQIKENFASGRWGAYKYTQTGYPTQLRGTGWVNRSYYRNDPNVSLGWVDCDNCSDLKVMTERSCKQAAKAYGGVFKKSASWNTLPRGCVKRIGYPHFYWNKSNLYSNCTKNGKSVRDKHVHLRKHQKACASGCSGSCKYGVGRRKYYTCHNRNNNIIDEFAYYTCDRGRRDVPCGNHGSYACVLNDPSTNSRSTIYSGRV
jgi:hypothetical protein